MIMLMTNSSAQTTESRDDAF